MDEKITLEDSKVNEPQVTEFSSKDAVSKHLWEIFLEEFLNHEDLKKVFLKNQKTKILTKQNRK